jgi:hypothetical protein
MGVEEVLEANEGSVEEAFFVEGAGAFEAEFGFEEVLVDFE